MLSETPQLTHVRRLTLSLIVSVSLNAMLIALIVYGMGGGFLLSRQDVGGRLWNIQHVPLSEDRTHLEVLDALSHMLPEQLVAKLGDSQLIEGVYSQRDLALGCLVSIHHFDIARALHGSRIPQERQISLPENKIVAIYPGLNDKQFEQIIAFVNHERWPLTPEGLFLALKQPSLRADTSLAESFCLTPEFLTLQRLFSRADAPVERSEILEVLLQSNWEAVQFFYQATLQVNESSPALRRRMLLTYAQSGSSKASYLILKSEKTYLKYLDDATVLSILNNLDTVTPEVETFVADLIRSPRGEKVLEVAQRLCSKALVAVVQEIETKQDKIYVVQKGDSLWKISKQTKVPIQTLKSYNSLESDVLKPGATLRIP
ncbi:MAG: LysM peptidoglycan-binding domain-containing protein [Chlamydiales bacterium]|nr:LysM peptidoglycan-binding domain-containing protein [Chlamydiales bacterium]